MLEKDTGMRLYLTLFSILLVTLLVTACQCGIG